MKFLYWSLIIIFTVRYFNTEELQRTYELISLLLVNISYSFYWIILQHIKTGKDIPWKA